MGASGPMKRPINPGQKAYDAEVKRLSLASSLGKPEALSGQVLTIRMIETIVSSSAQAAANRATTEDLRKEVRQLKSLVRRVRQDWLRPILYGLGGAITGGGIVAFIMARWLAGHY